MVANEVLGVLDSLKGLSKSRFPKGLVDVSANRKPITA